MFRQQIPLDVPVDVAGHASSSEVSQTCAKDEIEGTSLSSSMLLTVDPAWDHATGQATILIL